MVQAQFALKLSRTTHTIEKPDSALRRLIYRRQNRVSIRHRVFFHKVFACAQGLLTKWFIESHLPVENE